MTTIETQVKRKYFERYFQLKTRPNGEKYWCRTEDAPEELTDLVREIHNSYDFQCLPNDWVYQQIAYSFDYLEDRDFDDVICELEPDAYYSELDEWMKNPYAQGFCNDVMRDFDKFEDIYKLIGCAQVRAMETILSAVNDFIQAEEEEEEETEE